MSKTTRKRGFVAPQPSAAPATTFSQVLADFEVTNARVNEWYDQHESVDTFSDDQKANLQFLGYREARDRVFSTPALTPRDLAGKIATLYEMSGDLAYHPARHSHQEIVAKGSDADHALLSCYLDALSMTGAVPDIALRPIDAFAVEAAEVLKMERQLLASHDAALEVEWDERCMAAIDVADALPATAEHLASKVLGLRLIYENNGGLEQLDAGTTDARLLRDIAKTLIAMGIGA